MLPHLLLLLISVAPFLLTPVLSDPLTSAYNPFRAIAAQVPRKADPPVCCLKPLQPIEPIEDELLLSFEEWKQKQSAVQEKERAKERENNRPAHNTATKGSGVNLNGNDTAALVQIATDARSPTDVENPAKKPKAEPQSSHFRVPLTDRFNYASLECSARVHLADRLAKSSSSILSSKRDRYMLSPCNPPNKEKQFVVVELCEDIRIDTVQLANFEFFSGIFKDFRISVAKTHITREDAWTDVGFFRAKNVRGVQSFHPPTSLDDFYRYIRIEFLTHYGNEYYCPVSLLRVYGLTHLEQWKWDMWEEESRAKLDIPDARSPPAPAGDIANPPISEPIAEFSGNNSGGETGTGQTLSRNEAPAIPTKEEIPRSTHVGDRDYFHLSAWKLSPSSPSVQPSVQQKTTSGDSESNPSVSSTSEAKVTDHTPAPSALSSQPNNVSSTGQHASPSTSVAAHIPPPSNTPVINSPIPISSTPKVNHASHATITKSAALTANTAPTTTSSIVIVSTVSPIPAPTGGESIYRTIMNRLTALEANHTLYTRYVEQQTGAVRELLRRLAEDVGRLEGIGKSQGQTYQRTIRDWEKRQQQMQLDYGDLKARIEHLSDEIVLEKRLGIAQLCLLLAVLIFMGLTRGSRGDARPTYLTGSVRDWGRRHLSFSSEWSKHFVKGEDIPKPHFQAAWPLPLDLRSDTKIDAKTKRQGKRMPLEAVSMNIRSMSSDARIPTRHKSRSRTPSIRNGARPQQYIPKPPSTPPSVHRPQLQRSNSQTGGVVTGSGAMHKSARKWARTAHLHEVRSAERRRARVVDQGKEFDDENAKGEDAFGGTSIDPFWVRGNDDGGSVKGDVRIRPVKFKSPDENEGDPWVDTDLEGEEGDWDWKISTGRSVAFPGVGNGH